MTCLEICVGHPLSRNFLRPSGHDVTIIHQFISDAGQLNSQSSPMSKGRKSIEAGVAFAAAQHLPVTVLTTATWSSSRTL